MTEKLRGIKAFIGLRIRAKKKNPVDQESTPLPDPLLGNCKGDQPLFTDETTIPDANEDGLLSAMRNSKRRKPKEKETPAAEDFNGNNEVDVGYKREQDDKLERDYEETILSAIKMQDYDALMDFIDNDEIDVNVLTSEVSIIKITFHELGPNTRHTLNEFPSGGHDVKTNKLPTHCSYVAQIFPQGKRYLHECVVYDDHEACEILLDAGCDIDAQDTHGWTALHFAAAFNLTEMTQLLLDRGADTTKVTDEGKLASEYSEDPHLVQKINVASKRRALKSVAPQI